MGPFGTGEMIGIALLLVLLFGAKKIPELFRSLGRGISEFKQGMNDTSAEVPKEETSTKTEPPAG